MNAVDDRADFLLKFLHELRLFLLSFLVIGQFPFVVLMFLFELAAQIDVLLHQLSALGFVTVHLGRDVDALSAEGVFELQRPTVGKKRPARK